MKAERSTASGTVSCLFEAPIQEAARLMERHDCTEVRVVDAASNPVGTITARDIARRAVAAGMPANTPVHEVMRPFEEIVDESRT